MASVGSPRFLRNRAASILGTKGKLARLRYHLRIGAVLMENLGDHPLGHFGQIPPERVGKLLELRPKRFVAALRTSNLRTPRLPGDRRHAGHLTGFDFEIQILGKPLDEGKPLDNDVPPLSQNSNPDSRRVQRVCVTQ